MGGNAYNEISLTLLSVRRQTIVLDVDVYLLQG